MSDTIDYIKTKIRRRSVKSILSALVTTQSSSSIVSGGLVLIGSFDASSDTYPSGTISRGYIYISNGAGTSGTKFGQNGAWFIAMADNPGQTPSNWYVLYPDIL